MAHEIDINAGVASFAARTDAWHRLGQIVGHAMDAETALAAAHLAKWDVRKMRLVVPQKPVITDDGVTTPAPIPVDDHFATVRTNPITGNIDVLGVVGSKYEPVQNEESCALLNALTDESGAVFETAGALRGGREMFVTMRLPESMTFDGIDGSKDRTDFMLAALNSHDGYLPLAEMPWHLCIEGSPYGAISGVRHATGSIGFVAARVSGLYGRRVRRSATLGAWSWRQTVLAGCLAAALAGLSVPFGVPWLAAAGAIVAAVGGLASLVIIAARARLEGRRSPSHGRWTGRRTDGRVGRTLSRHAGPLRPSGARWSVGSALPIH